MVRILIGLSVLLLTIPASGQTFDFICPEVEVQVESGMDSVGFTVAPQILQATGATADSQGYAMGVSHDPAALNATSITNLLSFTPDFLVDVIYSNGWSVGVVYDYLGGVFVAFDVPVPMVEVEYETNPGFLTGRMQTVELIFSNSLGSPPTTNVVVVGGTSILANLVDGSVTFLPGSFLRGDVNADTLVDVADSIGALAALFIPTTDPLPCEDAADVNDDGAFDISDPIYLLTALFIAGAPAVPAPASCGPDPTDDTLPCSVGCP